MKNTITIAVIILILGVALLFRIIASDRQHDIEVDTVEYSRYIKLENLLTSSPDFMSASIYPNADYTILTLDGKYDIAIKSGYYMMRIKNKEDEDMYCKITDAIEVSLGAKENSSVDTCHATLDGIYSLGGISAEIFDNYKVLTVNSEEPAKLFNTSNTHIENEIISVDEIDYDIELEDYIITSIQTEYKDTTHSFSLCGNIYNTKNKEKSLIFKLYDESKNILSIKQYDYKNDTKKYIPFCLDFSLDINNVKYYSIGGLQ